MPTNKTKKEAVILAFLVIITLAGIGFFVVRLWLPEKNESKPNDDQIENTDDQLNVPKISISELRDEIMAGKDLILLDVQNYDDNLKATLPEAVSIPLDELNDRINELPKNKTIITFDSGESCQSCVRAAQVLLMSGYTDIKSLEGGVTDWAEAGYPVATGKDITVKNISASELNDKITINDNIIIIDVREEKEYQAGHIEQARYVPFAGIAKHLSDIPRDKQIIVYDQSDNRSRIVVKQMIKEGYLDTVNLLDGLDGWKKAGFELDY